MTRFFSRRATAATLSILLGLGMVVATAPAANAATSADTSVISFGISAGMYDQVDMVGGTIDISVPHTTTYFNFTATTADPEATMVAYNGDFSASLANGQFTEPSWLRLGNNIMTLTVTAADGVTVKQYTITVFKPSPPAPLYDLNLGDLTLSEGTLSPAFDSAVTSYTVDVPYATTSMTVTPGAVASGNTVAVTSTMPMTGTTTALAASGTLVTVRVTAPDSTFRDYNITVHRAAAPTASVALASLAVAGGTFTPTFDPAILNYTVTVPYAARFVDVAAQASAASDAHTLTINNAPFVDGVANVRVNYDSLGSSYSIVLTPANGAAPVSYSVTIKRDPPSNNAELSGLSLSAATLNPSFSNAETDYAMTVPYLTTSTTVTSAVADPTAIIRVNGHDTASGAASAPIALAVGANAITVQVTAEDTVTTTTRTIVVTREAPNLDLSTLTVNKGALSPAFDAATAAYTLVVPYTVATLDVAAAAVEADWMLQIDGVETGSATIAVPVGTSTITATVTALYGESRDYTITVTREAAIPAEFEFDLGFGAGSASAGAPVKVAAEHLLAGSTATLTMHSTPVVLASGIVLADGTIVLSTTLPNGIEPGAHRLAFEGTAEDGTPLTGTAWFTVLRNGTIGAVSLTGPVAYVEALVLTGADPAPFVGLGLLLLVAGAGAVFVASRPQGLTQRA